MKLSDLDTPIIEVYLSPIYGCKKPTVWIAYVGGMIKLGTFVNRETAEMFVEYFEDMGISCADYSEETDTCESHGGCGAKRESALESGEGEKHEAD